MNLGASTNLEDPGSTLFPTNFSPRNSFAVYALFEGSESRPISTFSPVRLVMKSF